MTTETTVKCPRCDGTGRYQDKGECFACKGTGVKNGRKTEVQTIELINGEMLGTKEDKLIIFNEMAEIIESKGARNKMVSTFDIFKSFQDKNVEMSRVLVESIMDVLIQWKYVRYFRNDRGFMYYGISETGWARYDQMINGAEVAPTSDSDIPPEVKLSPEGGSNYSPSEAKNLLNNSKNKHNK